MFRAQLTERDLATHLLVDPKTVQRWLDGRLPYPKYRGELSRLLGTEEADLWPELRALRAARSRPAELTAVYPRRRLILQEEWLRFFASAQREVNIVAYSAGFLLRDARLRQILVDKGSSGVRVAVAVGDPTLLDLSRTGAEEDASEDLSERIAEVVDLLRTLAGAGRLELRLHDALLYNSLYRVDGEALVNQHLYGIPAADAPVYHLHQLEQEGEMFEFYLRSFDRIWEDARRLDG
jgi:hypothetical protein